MQRGIPLDAVVAQSEAVLEQFGPKVQYLLGRRDARLVLDLVGTCGDEVWLCVWVRGCVSQLLHALVLVQVQVHTFMGVI